jgi:hypothetical protein
VSAVVAVGVAVVGGLEEVAAALVAVVELGALWKVLVNGGLKASCGPAAVDLVSASVGLAVHVVESVGVFGL